MNTFLDRIEGHDVRMEKPFQRTFVVMAVCDNNLGEVHKMQSWNDTSLKGNDIAIVFCAEDGGNADCGSLIALARGNGQIPVRVETEKIGKFLDTHSERRFVCYDVATLHSLLAEHLKQIKDQHALTLLWDLPRHNRLHDVMLLDQRLRVVKEGIFPKPRELVELAAVYSREEISQTSSQQLHVILAVHKQQLAQTEMLLSKLPVDRKVVGKFGPLGHGIDVQGAIAVHSPGRRLNVNLWAAKRLEQQLRENYSRSCQKLSQHPAVKTVFDWEGELILLDVSGRPQFKPKRMREWLRKQLNALTLV